MTEDPALMRAARAHSDWQEANGALGHDEVGDDLLNPHSEITIRGLIHDIGWPV
jgi:hypothetical protein